MMSVEIRGGLLGAVVLAYVAALAVVSWFLARRWRVDERGALCVNTRGW